MLGKWHLGGTATTRPEARGFDEALAFYDGASMFLPEGHPNVVNSKQEFDPIDKFLWPNLRFGVRYNGSKQFEPDVYMTDYLGREAVRAIEANKNRPFFMYLSFNAPHTPLQALKSDYDALAGIKDHRLRVYGGMIRALDRNVGLVLDALKAQGLEENTLVIFTSDNGGANYIGLPDINKPFRGWKATFFEGGIHVPFFMKWPAKTGQIRALRTAGRSRRYLQHRRRRGRRGSAQGSRDGWCRPRSLCRRSGQGRAAQVAVLARRTTTRCC